MRVFFADDSTQQGRRPGMGKLIAFGGVLIPHERLRELSDEVDRIASDAGVPTGTELKWSPPRENWIHRNLHGGERANCYRRVLEAAAGHGAEAFVVCWDQARTTLQGEKAFQKCVDFAFERVSTHLAKQGDVCIIVSDRPGGSHKEDKEFLEKFLDRFQGGTPYVPPDRVLLNILTTPSHLVRHLQIADLVTGITTAMVAGDSEYASPLFEVVQQLFVRNTFGYVGGTGLKLFPDQLMNLYLWVLGEELFTKVSRSAGIPLPHPKFPYAENTSTAGSGSAGS